MDQMDRSIPMARQLPADLVTSENITHGPALLKTIWSLVAISTIVLAARLWVKWTHARRIFLDDWIMVLALV